MAAQAGIKYLDLFAGIGGFHKGLLEAGFKIDACAYSEIDRDEKGKRVYAKAIYRHCFPDSIDLGDIRHVRSNDVISALQGKPDVVTFGWPCQDHSIAGRGEGLQDGNRSALLYEAGRLIDELQPGYFIAENVPGLLSSNAGTDYSEAIRVLSCIHRDGFKYTLKMCFYNTSWFLPQSRKRALFVGYLRGKRRPEILPYGKGFEGTIEGVSTPSNIRTLTAGGNSGGLHSNMTLVSNTIDSNYWRSGDYRNGRTMVAHCIDANYGKGHNPRDNRTVVLGAGQGSRVYGTDGVAPSICAGNGSTSSTHFFLQRVRGCEPARRERRMAGKAPFARVVEGAAPTVTTSFSTNNILNGVRRLTEVECERLQGFPDEWTKYGIVDGKLQKIPMTGRYKAIGNAVSVPVVRVIAGRVKDSMEAQQ